jgi:large subunit ribosomal protein L23
MSQNPHTVLASPLITEKATLVNAVGNQVVFKVDPRANKIAIKNAIEQLFQVKVAQVRTIQYMGKKTTRWPFDRTETGLEKGVCHPGRRGQH